MSHFTAVETKINSLSALAKACEKLGYHFTEGVCEITDYYRARVQAQAKIAIAGPWAVAVVREEGAEESYQLVADWSMIIGYFNEQRAQREDNLQRVQRGESIYYSQEQLQDELVREYSLVRVMESCAAEGYEIDASEIQINEDGSMALVAVGWGA